MQISCRVLSVKTATDRREKIATQLDSSKIPEWSFFDALDKDNLDIDFDYDGFKNKYHREPLFGEISALASHIKIIKDFIKSDATNLLVLEDDLVIDPYFKFELAIELMELCKIPYLKLYTRYYTPSKYINSFGRFSIYRAKWPPLGAQAYVFSKACAYEFINYINKFDKIFIPIDDLLDKFEDHKIPTYLLYPFPFMELTFPSTIFTQQFKFTEGANNKENFLSKTISKAKNYISRNKLEKEFLIMDNKINNTINNNMETFLRMHNEKTNHE